MINQRPFRLLLLCLVASLSLITGLALAQTDPTATPVEFIGVVDAMDTNTITVNGQVIDVSSAQLNTALQVGAEVEVQGVLDASNVIRAREVNAPSSLRPSETEFVGVLSGATGASVTVGGTTIDITNAVVDAGLSVGNVVRIAASRGDDGRWIAREVERVVTGASSRDPNAPLTPDDDFEIRGTLTSTTGNAIVVSGQTIDATNAQINGQLVLGAQVRARVTTINGQLVAREIRLFGDDGGSDDAACVTTAPAGWTTYNIRPGDTLSSVAARSGSSLAELARVNCISDVRLLIAGTTLFVPRPLADDNRNGNDNRDSDRGNDNRNFNSNFNDNRGSFNDNRGSFNDNGNFNGNFNDNRSSFNDNRGSFDSNRGSGRNRGSGSNRDSR